MTPSRPPVDTWWVRLRGDDARVRLLCLPSAGAGAAAYARWPELGASAGIQVLGARLPGRETRMAERPWSDIDQMVTALAASAERLLGRPLVLFGHSMGALLAFELAHRLRLDYQTEPAFLIVSGRTAPNTDITQRLSELEDGPLMAALTQLGGTPREILEEPELVSLMLPILRTDLQINDRYVYRSRPRLTCPIHAFIGRDDPLVDRRSCLRWAEETTGEFELREMAGGHFFFKTAPGDFSSAISALCLRAMAERER